MQTRPNLRKKNIWEVGKKYGRETRGSEGDQFSSQHFYAFSFLQLLYLSLSMIPQLSYNRTHLFIIYGPCQYSNLPVYLLSLAAGSQIKTVAEYGTRGREKKKKVSTEIQNLTQHHQMVRQFHIYCLSTVVVFMKMFQHLWVRILYSFIFSVEMKIKFV